MAQPVLTKLMRKRVSNIFKIRELALKQRTEGKLQEWKQFLDNNATIVTPNVR
jgi:hypothetical protein